MVSGPDYRVVQLVPVVADHLSLVPTSEPYFDDHLSTKAFRDFSDSAVKSILLKSESSEGALELELSILKAWRRCFLNRDL